jgi:hypothetical protein
LWPQDSIFTDDIDVVVVANMTLLSMATRPRRPVRLLALALFVMLVFYFMSALDLTPAIPFFGTQNWQGTMVKGVDVIKLIDPLIGTVNGGSFEA